ncbi:hypothetical protein Csa_004114 [Cucumis sativus]|uniref:Uncharacterized protein n=1 Tax=Cucumis sativus TaxID=3659 RepID=A0A0A0KH71_CUCSA|nr:hypothetical protein Csa_004114 [Cucumis sativus]
MESDFLTTAFTNHIKVRSMESECQQSPMMSQEVKAATLLHKAMEYDTNSRWRFQTGAIDIDSNLFVTLTPAIYEHNVFAPYLVKDWIYNPPPHKNNQLHNFYKREIKMFVSWPVQGGNCSDAAPQGDGI